MSLCLWGMGNKTSLKSSSFQLSDQYRFENEVRLLPMEASLSTDRHTFF